MDTEKKEIEQIIDSCSALRQDNEDDLSVYIGTNGLTRFSNHKEMLMCLQYYMSGYGDGLYYNS